MTTDVATRDAAPELLERVVIGGDLSKLTPADRLRYYREVCASVGLNPLTRPLEYLHLNGKLILYARRDATDQLRKLHEISVERLEREVTDGVYVVTVYVKNNAGRNDSDLGAVPIEGLKGEARANAMLKAVTKAKRRATLSICGLGMLDETEVETIPDARPVPLEEPRKPEPESPLPLEAEPTSGMDVAPIEEWITAIQQAGSAQALMAVWKGCTAPAIWPTWSPAEQARLTAEKDTAKARLGIA